MSRGIVATSVLVVWAGALAWLAVNEMSRPSGLDLDDAVRTVPPGANFYSVNMGDVTIGFASNMVDTVPGGLVVEDRLMIEVPAMGSWHRTDAHTVARLTNTLRLQSFEATLSGDAGRFRATGEVFGDTLLEVGIESAQSTQTLRIPLEEPIVLPAYLPLRLAFGDDLKVGAAYSVQTFDPLLLANRQVDVKILAESTLVVPDSAALDSATMRWVPARWDTLHAWQVEQSVNGVTLGAWIDDLGRIVSATSGIGFGMERSAFEIAFHNFRSRDRAAALTSDFGGDVIRQTAIASNVDLSQRQASTLRVLLGGIDTGGFDLVGGRQTLDGDTLTVEREQPDSLLIPYRLPAKEVEYGEYLRAEPLIQSDDPRIEAQARLIVGRVRNPLRAARRLNQWVYERLDKQITISVPSAVEVLETKRGDCNEHTVLYVAMARAVGIPARTAAGLAFANGRFYYHAWPEVYLGEWVAIDPTFGQFPAVAAHLRFTSGGLARQIELIRLIGQLELDIVAVEE